jgi:hypothetical protein
LKLTFRWPSFSQRVCAESFNGVNDKRGINKNAAMVAGKMAVISFLIKNEFGELDIGKLRIKIFQQSPGLTCEN